MSGHERTDSSLLLVEDDPEALHVFSIMKMPGRE